MSEGDNNTGVPEINEEFDPQNTLQEDPDNTASRRREKRKGRSSLNALYGTNLSFQIFMLFLAELLWLMTRALVKIINTYSPVEVSPRLTDWEAGLERWVESLKQGRDKTLRNKVSEALKKLEKGAYNKELKDKFERGELNLELNGEKRKMSFKEAKKSGISDKAIDKAIDKAAQKRCRKDISKGMWAHKVMGRFPHPTSSPWRDFPKGVKKLNSQLNKTIANGATNKEFLETSRKGLQALEKQSEFLRADQHTQRSHTAAPAEVKKEVNEKGGGKNVSLDVSSQGGGNKTLAKPKKKTVNQEQTDKTSKIVETSKVTSTQFNYITNESVNVNDLSNTEKKTETKTTTTKSQRKLGS